MNRVFPDGGAYAWRAAWVASRRRILDHAADSFAGPTVWTSVCDREPVGPAELTALARETYGHSDPLAFGATQPPMRVTTGGGFRCCRCTCRWRRRRTSVSYGRATSSSSRWRRIVTF